MICVYPEEITDVQSCLLYKMTASQWANYAVLGWRRVGSWLDVLPS